MKPEYALSIKPPWAYFIMYGIPYCVEVQNPNGSTSLKDSGKLILKDIENRDWPIPPSMKLPIRIMVHVSKKEDAIEGVLDYAHKLGLPFFSVLSYYSKNLPRGALLGEVDITSCVTESKSPWFVGRYGFTIANRMLYDKPIPCRGQLGFFRPNIEKAEAVNG